MVSLAPRRLGGTHGAHKGMFTQGPGEKTHEGDKSLWPNNVGAGYGGQKTLASATNTIDATNGPTMVSLRGLETKQMGGIRVFGLTMWGQAMEDRKP